LKKADRRWHGLSTRPAAGGTKEKTSPFTPRDPAASAPLVTHSNLDYFADTAQRALGNLADTANGPGRNLGRLPYALHSDGRSSAHG
jgi:hypothetical protein